MAKTMIVHAAQLATPIGKEAAKGKAMGELKIIEDAAVYIEDGIIGAIGTTDELTAAFSNPKIEMISAEGSCILPGFVDSHTHFIFGGYRPDEFIDRLEGKSYMDIMRMGGGIQSTVNSTRNASLAGLIKSGKERLDSMLMQGVTTVEGKSGYGLDYDCEMKQLQAMKRLGESHPIDIVTTYLGAHAVPAEYKGKSEKYIEYMIKDILPEVRENSLAKFCDVFCEEDVFSVEESERLLLAAGNMGFQLKIHADEIVSFGGAELAGRVKCTSADHLLMISADGIKSLLDNDVTATLLPCTAFCLNKPYAPARKLIDSGCAVALASDFNPGSCFADSIPLLMALGAINMKMTVEEVVTAMTLNGASALGMAEETGSLEIGKQADIVFLTYDSYKFLVYNTGSNLVKRVMKAGKIVYER